MKNEEDDLDVATQINLALEQRNAARDYHEYFVPGSIKLLLATRSLEKLNQMALANSRMFRYRFGFEPPRLQVRQQVLDIQKNFELTDEEIRWLRHAGHLVISRHEAKIVVTRLSPISGWLQMTALSMVCGALIIQINLSGTFTWNHAVALLAVSSIWIGLGWFLNSLYLAPWRTIKRSGILKEMQ